MPQERDIADMMKEFVDALMTYLKQRGAEFMTAVVVEPLRKAAGKLGLGCAGAVLLSLAVVFLGIFMVRGFAWLFGDNYTWGYLATAVLLALVGLLLLWLMSRSSKEEEEDNHGKEGGRAKGHQ